MFRKWVQSKYEQRKQEELLKCHEDEERNSFMQPRSQEENDRAYRRQAGFFFFLKYNSTKLGNGE